MFLGCILSFNLSICFSRGTRPSRHRQAYVVLTQWASSSSDWPEAHTRRDLEHNLPHSGHACQQLLLSLPSGRPWRVLCKPLAVFAAIIAGLMRF